MSGIVYDDAHIGCHLDGYWGWHNGYHVVDMATSHGMTLDAEETAALDMYRSGRPGMSENEWEIMNGQGGLVEMATEFLGTITASGLEWIWDMGGLFLIPACQTEDPTSPADCDHCVRGQFS